MADTTETGSGETGSDMQEVEARDTPEAARAQVPADNYNPLKNYDPEREFKFIEKARSEIDETLLKHTGPFAEGIILLIHLSTLAIVWSAAVIPALYASSWFGYQMPALWHAVIIFAVPGPVLLFALAWLFIRLPIKLKWTAVYLEMYLDDEISNLLIRERDASKGELKGIHIGSNVALLRLLRLRMKAFHFWHRISIHTFILNGMFFRRVLETPFRAPRLWANGVPLLVLVVFLSVQWGILTAGTGISGNAGEIVYAFAEQLWNTLQVPRLGGGPTGPLAVPFIAAAFMMAYGAYWLARRARPRVTQRLESFLNTESFLTPFTHDSSREILAKHEKLIRIMARILVRGRNGHGETGSTELSALILEEGLDDSGVGEPL